MDLGVPFDDDADNLISLLVKKLLLRREVLKYLGKCQIKVIPPQILEMSHLKHLNQTASRG